MESMVTFHAAPRAGASPAPTLHEQGFQPYRVGATLAVALLPSSSPGRGCRIRPFSTILNLTPMGQLPPAPQPYLTDVLANSRTRLLKLIACSSCGCWLHLSRIRTSI